MWRLDPTPPTWYQLFWVALFAAYCLFWLYRDDLIRYRMEFLAVVIMLVIVALVRMFLTH